MCTSWTAMLDGRHSLVAMVSIPSPDSWILLQLLQLPCYNNVLFDDEWFNLSVLELQYISF